MKRAFLTVLSLMFLLSSCTAGPSGQESVPADNSSAAVTDMASETTFAQVPGETETIPQMTEAEQQNYLADPMFDTEDYLPEYDCDNAFFQPFRSAGLIEGEKAFYACDTAGQYLYYYDKLTAVSGPLCAKPDCTHSDESCDAYIGMLCYSLSFYDGRLYWLAKDEQEAYHICLWSMNADGTDRKTVFTLETEAFMQHQPQSVTVHRGYAYFLYKDVKTSGAKTECRVSVEAYSLKDGKDRGTVLFERSDSEIVQCAVRFYGNTMLIGLSASGGEKQTLSLYVLDLKTRNLTEQGNYAVPNGITDLWKAADGTVCAAAFKELYRLNADGSAETVSVPALALGENTVFGNEKGENGQILDVISDFQGKRLYAFPRPEGYRALLDASFSFSGDTFCALKDGSLYCMLSDFSFTLKKTVCTFLKIDLADGKETVLIRCELDFGS